MRKALETHSTYTRRRREAGGKFETEALLDKEMIRGLSASIGELTGVDSINIEGKGVLWNVRASHRNLAPTSEKNVIIRACEGYSGIPGGDGDQVKAAERIKSLGKVISRISGLEVKPLG